MYITPAIPESGSIKLDTFLFKKAEEIVMKSAKLTGGHNKQFILAIKDLLKITNSYYSNLIESEGTHPFDIEKAMKKDFSLEKCSSRFIRTGCRSDSDSFKVEIF